MCAKKKSGPFEQQPEQQPNIPADKDREFPGYPVYPESEDIYSQALEEVDLDPENPTKTKAFNEDPDSMNEKSFSDDVSGADLDIPGSELDDEQEEIGSEDEENNYYSLGDDRENESDNQ